MAASIIDSLIISLGLDTTDVERGINEAERAMANGLRSIASVVAPLLGAIGLNNLKNNYIEAATALGALSKLTRASVEDIDAWGNAVVAQGGTVDAFRGTLTSLNTALNDIVITGTSSVVPTLRRLGVDMSLLRDRGTTAIDVLEGIAASAGKIDPRRFERLAKGIGLDQGTIDLLKTGRVSVDELVSSMRELSYTQRDAEIVDEYNTVTQKLSLTLEAASAQFMRVFVPALNVVSNVLQKGVAFLRKHEPFVIGFVTALAGALTLMLLPALRAVGRAALAAIAPFLPLIAVVTGLALLFDDLWVYIEGGKSRLDSLWSVFGTGEEIGKALKDTWESLKQTGQELWQSLIDGGKWVLSFFGPTLEALSAQIRNTFGLIKAFFSGDAAQIEAAAATLFDGMGRLFEASFDDALNFVSTLFNRFTKNLATVNWDAVFAGIGRVLRSAGRIGLMVMQSFVGFLRKINWRDVFAALYAIFSGLGSVVIAAVTDALNALSRVDWGDVFDSIVDALTPVADEIFEILYSAFADVWAAVKIIFAGISNFFGNIFNNIRNSLKGFVADIIKDIPTFLLPDSLVEWANNVGTVVAENAPSVPGNSSGSLTPAAANATTIDSSSETNVTVQKIEVNPINSDPNVVGAATASEIRKLVSAGNKGVVNR